MAHEVWYTQVGIYRVKEWVESPDETVTKPAIPQSILAACGWGFVSGSYASGRVKVNIPNSEIITAQMETEFMNMGASKASVGVCTPAIVDYTDRYYDDGSPYTSTSTTTTSSSTSSSTTS